MGGTNRKDIGKNLNFYVGVILKIIRIMHLCTLVET